MPNAHSHAFQRALRGLGERPLRQAAGRDDFWSWRTAMFELAERLGPDSMYETAERVYREMVEAGYGAVAEFHYVHHQPDGKPYDDPNELAYAVVEAARAAGIRIVVLPAAYCRNGWDGGDVSPSSGQIRFCDPDVDTFLARVDALHRWADGVDDVTVGIAAHSVRAVPATWLREIAAYADARGVVRHIHAHEQPRELEQCRAEHGCSPIELLSETGFLGPETSIVHGIHVSERDVQLLAEHRAIVISCPTTEGNLGDGWFPALAYRNAGVRVAIGSDSHVRIDPFEEVRELETGARRQALRRFGLLAASGDLWADLCANGCSSLGLANAGELAVDLESSELASVSAEDLPYALATCASAAVVAGTARLPTATGGS
jgi:formimidoylglutamate deiminase